MVDQKSYDNPLELKFSSIFEADSEFVFKALTHPDLIKKWFGPRGYSCPVVEVNLHAGGNYHIEMKPPEGGIVKLNGVYKVVNLPNRLEFTWKWEEPDSKETLVKVQFDRTGKRTKVSVEQGEFANVESKEGHEKGWLASFERLRELLESRKT